MLKILACLFMLFDHISAFFLPEIFELRLVGRISMPLFAFCIARGAFFTRSREKYIFRIAILAGVSQMPFALFLQIPFLSNLNICFTWLLALLIIHFQEASDIPKFLKGFVFFVIVVIAIFVPMDYGLYGVLMPLFFYYCFVRDFQYRWALFFYVFVLSIAVPLAIDFIKNFYISSYAINFIFIQLPSILSLPLIKFLSPHDKKLNISKYVFYWFYPVHFLIIIGAGYLLCR